ncbi:adenylate/guanylate cyclase domain-containing protein [Aegicerativicinus sediminis]|uniref:adenylate/guanylate cyclase domain-containing protein n=1 Tax=Aegicerativicinus sediminis TaxID=2893202 RepID=UPI001E3C5139|nr:adenylate/guanylate cyclase domain-containing protein [Aegicerativicinus sediminis]
MTRSGLLLIILMLLSYILFPQDLGQLKAKETQITQSLDSVQVNTWNDRAFEFYQEAKYDSTIVFAKKAIQLSDSIHYKSGLGLAYKYMGMAHYQKAEYAEAISNWEPALNIYRDLKDDSMVSNLLNNVGAAYQTLGDDPTALKLIFESLEIAERLNDKQQMASCYVNMGSVYMNDKNTYPQAINALEQSIKISEEINNKGLVGYSELNIGDILLQQDKYIDAALHLEKAIDNWKEINYFQVSYAEAKMAAAQSKLGNYLEAQKYIEEAITTAKENEDKLTLSEAYNTFGTILYEQGKFNASIEQHSLALDLAKEMNTYKEIRNSYRGLADANAGLGNYSSAYQFQQLFTATQDTLKDEEYNNTMGILRYRFNVGEQEKEMERLIMENQLKQSEIEKEATARKLLMAILILLVFIIGGFIFQYRYVKRSHKRLDREKKRSERILLNILPKETAEELKNNGFIKAKRFENVTVLFTDFKAFSVVAENISPEDLVNSVDYFFKKFDEIIERNNLEKIKTIGDAYMCAGGLPSKNHTHAEDALNAAREILQFVKVTAEDPPDGIFPFEVRIGLNTGPVIAGVVGTKKFQYDIWGNTVNIAARMESNSEVGRINVSQHTYEHLKDKGIFTYRGEVEVKNQKKLKMYYIDQSTI